MAFPQSELAQDPLVDVHNPNHMRNGTLNYTKTGLILLFLYLLWGDFCFSLMETVVPSVLQLKLHASGASNVLLGLIVTTIPNIMNMVINPFASFRSDRFRSKWGRRIPFLVGATPFVTLFLILLGYSDPISNWVHTALLSGKYSDTTVLLGIIGVFMVCFQFFNLFITSVYYYLFNDVVPHAFLARFMSLFRIVGIGAGNLYSFFLLKFAGTHMQEIFLGAALLYFVAFAVMCLRVKEGEYPPPPPNIENQEGFIATLETYFTECFTHRFYWFFFLTNGCTRIAWVTASYSLLLSTTVLGFNLDFIGKVGAVCGVISMILLYPGGIIADRFHPLRVFLVTNALQWLITPLVIVWVWIVRPEVNLHTAMIISIGLSAMNLPIATLGAAAEFPMMMKLLPQERYGQFCSANALICSIALIVGGVACGEMLDFVKPFHPNPDFCYRYLPIWNFLFQTCSLFFLYMVYREWTRLGGMTGYVPPKAEPSTRLVAFLGRIFRK